MEDEDAAGELGGGEAEVGMAHLVRLRVRLRLRLRVKVRLRVRVREAEVRVAHEEARDH